MPLKSCRAANLPMTDVLCLHRMTYGDYHETEKSICGPFAEQRTDD